MRIRMKDEGGRMNQRIAHPLRPDSSLILHPSSLPARAFTLIELMVVIGIIVLLILVAVPALGLITGSRSVDRAENNLSALLGRARADALGLQRDTGVMFFIDPATQGVTAAEVFATSPPAAPVAGIDVYLDFVADRDFLPMPKGVGAQVVD